MSSEDFDESNDSFEDEESREEPAASSPILGYAGADKSSRILANRVMALEAMGGSFSRESFYLFSTLQKESFTTNFDDTKADFISSNLKSDDTVGYNFATIRRYIFENLLTYSVAIPYTSDQLEIFFGQLRQFTETFIRQGHTFVTYTNEAPTFGIEFDAKGRVVEGSTLSIKYGGYTVRILIKKGPNETLFRLVDGINVIARQIANGLVESGYLVSYEKLLRQSQGFNEGRVEAAIVTTLSFVQRVKIANYL